MFFQSASDEGGYPRDMSVLVELTAMSDSELRLTFANRVAALVAACAALLMGITAVIIPTENGPAEFLLLVLLVAGAINAPICAGALWRVVHEFRDREWRERLMTAARARGPRIPDERSVAEVRKHPHD